MSVKRSGDVTAAAVVMFCGSGLFLLRGAFTILTVLAAPTTNAAQGRQLQMTGAVMIVVIYGGLAAWGIATGVGILKLRPWARISAIVMSVLAIAGCVMAAASVFAMQSVLSADNQLPPNFARMMLVIVSVMFAIPAGIAIWWVILFTRKRVALEFATRGGVAGGATPMGIAEQGNVYGGAANEFAGGGSVAPAFGAVPTVASSSSGARRPAIPMSIRVIAVASIVFSAFGLLAVPFFFMGMMTPVLMFGFLVKGNMALVYFFAVDLLPLAFGIALLRRQAWSADAMIAFLAAMVVNLGMFYISAQRTAYDSALQSATAQMLKRMNLPVAPPPEASRAAFVGFDVRGHVFQNWIFGLTMALYVLVLFFLAMRRKAFRDGCEK